MMMVLPATAICDEIPALAKRPAAAGPAEIRIVDEATGRGVPLVELETVNNLLFVTDNAGRVAFLEPELMGREIYFTLRSHGYEVKKDGFGYAGVRATPRTGEITTVRVTRTQIAERIGRLTGEGRFRDSELLGYDEAQELSVSQGKVAGQDSVQAAIYRGKIHWFWGDTLRMEYPLGLFRVAGATTPLFDPRNPRTDPASSIPYHYFVDAKSGFTRAMMPLLERPEGVVWIFSLAVVPNEQGEQKLVAHYTRRKGLEEELEHGIVVYQDEQQVFDVVRTLPLKERWRKPSGHPIVHQEDGTKWLYYGSPTPNVRVPAKYEAVLDPEQYEAFSCLKFDSEEIDRREDGTPNWRWQKSAPPVDASRELKELKSGKVSTEYVRFLPANVAEENEIISLHNGTVRWNAFRKKWVMIAVQAGGKPSYLGEVWYSEAHAPTGPFRTAVRIVTHNRQTFYNVCHHDFLDRDNGRTIFFEGTYTNEFSGNPHKTPRYNYNQILYRMDLNDPRLKPVQKD